MQIKSQQCIIIYFIFAGANKQIPESALLNGREALARSRCHAAVEICSKAICSSVLGGMTPWYRF